MSGLEIEEKKIGSGVAAHRGDTVTVRYSGYLNRGDAFQTDVTTDIILGKRRVIAGLEYGIEGMKVHGASKSAPCLPRCWGPRRCSTKRRSGV